MARKGFRIKVYLLFCGNVFVDGENINEKGVKLKKIREKVGMVFQYPEYQLFEETVFKDISFGPRNMGLSDDEVKKSVIPIFSRSDADLHADGVFLI